MDRYQTPKKPVSGRLRDRALGVLGLFIMIGGFALIRWATIAVGLGGEQGSWTQDVGLLAAALVPTAVLIGLHALSRWRG